MTETNRNIGSETYQDFVPILEELSAIVWREEVWRPCRPASWSPGTPPPRPRTAAERHLRLENNREIKVSLRQRFFLQENH